MGQIPPEEMRGLVLQYGDEASKRRAHGGAVSSFPPAEGDTAGDGEPKVRAEEGGLKKNAQQAHRRFFLGRPTRGRKKAEDFVVLGVGDGAVAVGLES